MKLLSDEFMQLKNTVDTTMKARKASGVGVFYSIGLNFALRVGQEHRNLRFEEGNDSQLKNSCCDWVDAS